MEIINEFKGKYRFLSNFYKCPIEYEGKTYPSAENAFQAAKCLDDSVRDKFLKIEPAEAKKLGKTVALNPDWEHIKLDVMYTILKTKFSDPKLREMLLSTGEALIYEGNTWGDTFWGYDIKRGYGHNHLGRMLMQLRLQMLKGDI